MGTMIPIFMGLFFVGSADWAPAGKLEFEPTSPKLKDAYIKITDHKSSERELLQAIKNLDKVIEPARFWVNIANDKSYTTQHRHLCTQQLIIRHIRPGMTLKQVSERFRGVTWLASEKQVFHLKCLGGWIPVDGIPGIDSIFSIATPDPERDFIICIRGTGITGTDILHILRGENVDAKMSTRTIYDVWPRKED